MIRALTESLFVAHGLPVPVPEFRIDPARRYRWDWTWPERKIALEIQGGVYGRGRKCPACGRRPVGAHSSIRQLKADIEKRNIAQEHGWRVFECLPEDLESGAVFGLLRRVLGNRGA